MYPLEGEAAGFSDSEKKHGEICLEDDQLHDFGSSSIAIKETKKNGFHFFHVFFHGCVSLSFSIVFHHHESSSIVFHSKPQILLQQLPGISQARYLLITPQASTS